MKNLITLLVLLFSSQLMAQDIRGVFDMNSKLIEILETYEQTGNIKFSTFENSTPKFTIAQQFMDANMDSFEFYAELGNPKRVFESLRIAISEVANSEPLRPDATYTEQLNFLEKQNALLMELVDVMKDLKRHGYFSNLKASGVNLDLQELELTEKLEKEMTQTTGHSPLTKIQRNLQSFIPKLPLVTGVGTPLVVNLVNPDLGFLQLWVVSAPIAASLMTLYWGLTKTVAFLQAKGVGISATMAKNINSHLKNEITVLKEKLIDANEIIREVNACMRSAS
ncbi:MAG: hypothetical protein VX583_12510 [Bdellovibrionota bacterium]|nr:hypothetical protein [Pseudobdellovibrionaceae bacterium]